MNSGLLATVRRILFYGDSMTDGSSHPDFVVNTLKRVYPEADFRLENSAKCGDRVCDLLERFEADVVPKHPDLVFVSIGTNDVLRGLPLEQFRNDYRTLVDRIRALPARVALVRPSHLADPGRNAAFRAYIEIISDVGRETCCPVIDLYGAFERWAAEGGKKLLGPDGIHYGEDGWACAARVVIDGLGLEHAPLELVVKPRPGTILDWEVSAPVDLDRRLEPSAATGWQRFERAPLMATLAWWDKPMVERGAVALAVPQPEQTVSFARATVTSEVGRQALLEIGGWPPIAIWVNDNLVWNQTAPHGYHPNTDRVAVTLKKGDNRILLSGTVMAYVGIAE